MRSELNTYRDLFDALIEQYKERADKALARADFQERGYASAAANVLQEAKNTLDKKITDRVCKEGRTVGFCFKDDAGNKVLKTFSADVELRSVRDYFADRIATEIELLRQY